METTTTTTSRQALRPRSAPRRVDPRLVEDPFFYGYRWVETKTPDGRRTSEQVPLTEADLLDPQEDDKVSNRLLHDVLTSRLGEILRTLFAFRQRPDVVVTGNVKILWQDPKIKRVAPDLAVIPNVKNANVKNAERDFTSFSQAKEGTRPIFALEVTSDATEDTDLNQKPAVYASAGVEEYFILDQEPTPWVLTARRLNPQTGRYRKIQPDKRGRIASQTLEVFFEIDERSLVLTDMRTGERLRDHQAEAEGRRAEAEARQADEKARLAEAEARQVAEKARLAEAEGRQAAEKARLAEAEARQAAEKARLAEAEARQAAEEKVRQLAAEIELLKARLG